MILFDSRSTQWVSLLKELSCENKLVQQVKDTDWKLLDYILKWFVLNCWVLSGMMRGNGCTSLNKCPSPPIALQTTSSTTRHETSVWGYTRSKSKDTVRPAPRSDHQILNWVSKLVFYAQSTSVVISGWYSKLKIKPMAKTEVLNIIIKLLLFLLPVGERHTFLGITWLEKASLFQPMEAMWFGKRSDKRKENKPPLAPQLAPPGEKAAAGCWIQTCTYTSAHHFHDMFTLFLLIQP